MKKSTKVLATAGIGVGVGVATAAFLKTEKGQEVKEAVKEKVSQLVDEFEEFKKEKLEELAVEPKQAKFFFIPENFSKEEAESDETPIDERVSEEAPSEEESVTE